MLLFNEDDGVGGNCCNRGCAFSVSCSILDNGQLRCICVLFLIKLVLRLSTDNKTLRLHFGS